VAKMVWGAAAQSQRKQHSMDLHNSHWSCTCRLLRALPWQHTLSNTEALINTDQQTRLVSAERRKRSRAITVTHRIRVTHAE
jgi:hypothetical protein